MIIKVMVCGVDCRAGDKNCNGYCIGRTSTPPQAPQVQKVGVARDAAHLALDAAERAWYEYARECEVGADQTLAFDVYAKVRSVRLAVHSGGLPVCAAIE